MDGVGDIHKAITKEIVDALNIVVPLERMVTKERKVPLYLSPHTRKIMKERDIAAASTDCTLYHKLRNKANCLVKCDKMDCNMNYLESKFYDPTAIWQIANAAAGRSAKSLLLQELDDGVRGDLNLSNQMNELQVNKILKIRARISGDGEDEEQQQQQQRREQTQH